jgi:ribonuclease G
MASPSRAAPLKEFRLPWFRFRRKLDDDAGADATAPTGPDPSEPAVTDTTADAVATTDSTKPRRRRGSRGGRGRKKSGTAVAEAATARAEKPTRAGKSTSTKAEKPKPARAEPRASERKQLSQRQERRREQGRRRQPARRAPLPAAKRELLVSVDVGEQRVAVLEDGKVAEVYIERPERRSIAGNIYLGVVDNVLPGMEAAFVEIGLEKNGFLYVDEIVGPELERGHGRKIQDLISRGQTILVQAVKDPMKTKGARLTTQISLPGRFVVFVPQGEGLGVSRRLEDDERTRLKEILKRLDVKEGGVIVRTAAEGASEEDVERDLVFLQRLWRSIQARAKTASAPELVYQEAELPLRVIRDLFTGDFERAHVDNERAYRRIVGYLKKTSPHMVERLVRHKEAAPLMDAFGVEQEIKSTLNRRVDLPSGGYLVFDYAEAFTVIDVNTGRFVGSRGKNSAARLEDTITKNNLEAVKEVVRQLRLRDIGGIIVIDFIDMANPKNRATVEEALRSELERDRTKTYVVEISPLGLVEMTRQNVTEGPREVMTRKCPTCGGDGIVYSEASAAIDVERRLRALAAGSRSQAFRVELADAIASALVGPGARRLVELETLTKKRFFLEGKPGLHLDHFVVLAEGKLADLAPEAPVEEGAEVMLQLVEVDRHDGAAAVGKLDGLAVVVADAASLVGKRQRVRVERVLDGTAYAILTRKTKQLPEPLTAEAEAEKPTRKPPARKTAAAPTEEPEASGEPAGVEAEAPGAEQVEVEVEDTESAAEIEEAEPSTVEETDEAAEAATVEETDEAAEQPVAKRKTRRGSRGGRKRRKKPVGATVEASDATGEDAGAVADEPEAEAESAGARIHLPPEDLGRPTRSEPEAADAEPAVAQADDAGASSEGAADSDGEPKPKRKTRRGSRGGRKRRKPAEAGSNGASADAGSLDAEPESAERETAEIAAPSADRAETAGNGGSDDWEYVPMSEWLDEIDQGR